MTTHRSLLASGVIVCLLPSAASAQFNRRTPAPAPAPTNVYVAPPKTAPPVGPAAMTNAQSQSMIATQQANLMKEQNKQAKIDTQRKAFDELNYEKARTPTPEEERERKQREQLHRSRNDPPLTEIWSSKALNDVLVDLQKPRGYAAVAAPPLDPGVLKRINVTTGKSPGLGLLRDAGKLSWPLVLQAEDFASDRKSIDALFLKAAQQARAGGVDAATLRSLISAVNALNGKIKQRVSTISSTQYIDARHFIDQLQQATTTLQEPQVEKYFTVWVAKGNTVDDLVRHMTAQGLRFSAVTAGDEASYTALHRAMANYDVAITPYVSAR